MQISTDRILTTHTGSLPRPKSLIDLVLAREGGQQIDAAAFEAQTAKAVDDIVAQQVAAGVDVVSDGEMSKPSYTQYIRHRVTGIAPDPRAAEKGRDIMHGPRSHRAPRFFQSPAELRQRSVSRLRRATCGTPTAAHSTATSPTSRRPPARRSRPRSS